MTIKVLLNPFKKGIMPTKAHEDDAGFDLYAPHGFAVFAHESAVIDLGVCFQIPKGYVGFIKSKSGLNVNSSLTCEGVIDSGYTGSVRAKVYNNSDKDYFFNKGDKVTQIVFLPIPEVKLEKVDTLEDTERGDNGFGSTGR